MSEARKVLPLIQPMLSGKRVLDLGCGLEKVVPWSVGVDDGSEHTTIKPDLVAKIGATDKEALVAKLKSLGLPGLGGWQVVFSSHALEHLREPLGENLWWWWSLVALKGHLVLYLPNEYKYVYDPKTPRGRNPAHKHLLTPDVVRWHIDQLTGGNPSRLDHDYSTLFIVEKVQ